MRSSDKFGDLDRIIIDRLERALHRLQRETGWTNFTVARVLIIAMSILNLVTIFAIDATEPNAHLMRALLGLLSFYTFLSAMKIGAAERAAFERIAKGLANPHKADGYQKGVRIAFLVGSPFAYCTFFALSVLHLDDMLPLAIAGIVMLLATPTIYALTCDPLPPCSGRLKEKISELFKTRTIDTAAEHRNPIRSAS